MSGAEAAAAIQLIDACIGITKTILDIGRAVKDAQGLPPKLRDLCEKLPAIEELLETARDSCEDGKVDKDNSNSAEPILKQCEQALAELRDLFRKACPKDGDDRTKRIWRGARTVFFGRDSQVQKLLVSVQDNLKLLEQKEVFRIGDKLDELQQLTEALAQDGDGRITHTGSGNILANQGGSHTNYMMSGSGRQINNPGVYNEGPSTHTYLTVNASVAGLISQAGQLVPALYDLGSVVREADKDAQSAAVEVAGMSVVLQGLQKYITGRSRANPQRLRLITVEHITASLTACVFTYSELDEVLKTLNADTGLKPLNQTDRLTKRDSIQSLVLRMQSHKLTFTCMLNILQCDSAAEAENNMDRLCDQVDLLHSENKELSARLRNLEHLSKPGFSRRTVASITKNSIRQDRDSLHSRSRTSALSRSDSLGSKQSGIVSLPGSVASEMNHNEPYHRSAFEEQLHRSRVYRHAHANHSESSLVDDGRSTLALSICSSLTLGEVSNISVFAIPIFAKELSNPSAYDFATPTEAAKICIPSQTDSISGDGRDSKSQKEAVNEKTNISSWFRNFKRNSKKPQELPVPLPGTFGVPLHTSIRYANVAISLFNEQGESYIYGYVPICVAKIGGYLKEKATTVEDIFATGSPPLQIQKLQLAFDSPPRYGKGLDWTGYTVHDAANILVRYLLQLPEGVVPLEFYVRFRDPLIGHQAAAVGTKEHGLSCAVDPFDEFATIRTYQALISELPPLNRQLLLYLLDLFAVFASKSDVNKMITSKLAKVFQPGILSHPQHSSFVAERQLSEDVITFLVENQDHFLLGMTVTDRNENSEEERQENVTPGEVPGEGEHGVNTSIKPVLHRANSEPSL